MRSGPRRSPELRLPCLGASPIASRRRIETARAPDGSSGRTARVPLHLRSFGQRGPRSRMDRRDRRRAAGGGSERGRSRSSSGTTSAIWWRMGSPTSPRVRPEALDHHLARDPVSPGPRSLRRLRPHGRGHRRRPQIGDALGRTGLPVLNVENPCSSGGSACSWVGRRCSRATTASSSWSVWRRCAAARCERTTASRGGS